MNKNYNRGRAFEYEIKAKYQKLGFSVLRTAGSKGEFDLIAYHPKELVQMIQCKRVKSLAEGGRIANAFRVTPHSWKNPPEHFDIVFEFYNTNTRKRWAEVVA
jgi:Holliday junction resolvase-like predicted endonuclease